MPASPHHLSLFQSHRAALIAYAAAISRDHAGAEDIVQEAWIRLDGSEAFAAAARPDAYLYRVVRNLALDGGRRARFEHRHFTADPAASFTTGTEDPDPETAAVSRDELQKTLAVLQTLPHRMIVAVRMHRFEGARLKDVAERLGVSVTVAHELVAEGVERCRQALRRGS